MLKVYTYDNKKLNISDEKIKYINVKDEKEIKEDLINTDRFIYADTYLILKDGIMIKHRRIEYKLYRIITEIELQKNLDEIVADTYELGIKKQRNRR